jgi:hypothetical protein
MRASSVVHELAIETSEMPALITPRSVLAALLHCKMKAALPAKVNRNVMVLYVTV